ncbi:MAG TPA: tRNA (adenosine(37)-N6)-threonylcarbamoyltransferase complex dimerization subunit type 1 TsaB [Coriobacteriia bacterium]|nr:tRNA (adenosine(37)-N6)-threonylcarbamoyltransferase complex dimerization subunit type 1 TsaB [Coriobacteriia bacterium]
MRPFVALDTSTDHVALAVGDLDAPGAVLASEDFEARRAANTALLPALERLMAFAGVGMAEIAAILCGRGPGSFTGVRIAMATAKGLAHGLGVPLVGVGTLDAVAVRAQRNGLVAVVGDAMRGEVYPALFRVASGRAERLTADRVARPEAAAAEWAALDEGLTLTGWGLVRHGDTIRTALRPEVRIAAERMWVPDGASLIHAAWSQSGPGSLAAIARLARVEALAAAHPAALLPVYTRLSDAEEAEVRAGGLRVPPAGGVAGPGGGGAS